MGGRRSPEDCNRSSAPDPVGYCKMSKRFLLKLCCSVETVTQSCSALSVVYRNSCALVGGAIKRNAKHVLCGRRRIQRGVYEVQEVATRMTVDAICWCEAQIAILAALCRARYKDLAVERGRTR